MTANLDGVAASEAEHHIETCADCQQASADAAQLSDAIHSELAPHRAPEALLARIGAMLDEETAPRVVVPFKRKNFWYGALSGAGAMAVAASVAFMLILPPSAETLAQSITDDHTAALTSGHLIQIASSSHHVVKPWLCGPADVSPPTPDFPDQNFILTGGRVDQVAGSKAAVVIYKHGRHVIDMFVWPDKGTVLPGNATRHGYHSIFWKSGDLNFAAVLVTPNGVTLEKFVGLVRSQPE